MFKNVKYPQVLWIGLNVPIELIKLHKEINEITLNHGFKNNHPTFSPHYTIGRIKNISSNHNLSAFIEKYKDSIFGEIDITEFIFYESILKPTGPIYKTLYKYPLT